MIGLSYVMYVICPVILDTEGGPIPTEKPAASCLARDDFHGVQSFLFH